MIDENGELVGVLPKDEAIKLAYSKGLDIIEISPTATPPVAKLISYDKFRYQQEKEAKKQKQSSAGNEMKQIRITARAAGNDLRIKIKQLEEFLAKGNKVEIMLALRGREKYNRNWANTKLKEFLEMITASYQITAEPKFGGRGMFMQIVKK